MEKNTRLVELGKRIRAIRKSKEMSQDELAKLCGYNSRSSINKIEAGLNDIPQSKIKAIADALRVSPAWLMDGGSSTARHGVKIPVLGHVVAGYPIEAVENVIGEEEISEEMARSGDYFALIVNGQSMTPTLNDGDTVIIQKTPIAHSGQIAVVMVNGDEATLKEIKLEEDGLWLIGHNPSVYPPKFYTAHEVEMLPVTICGVLVELRRSFN